MRTADWLIAYEATPSIWIASVIFIFNYTFLQPWWRDPIGITLVVLDGALFLVTSLNVLSTFFGIILTGAFWAWFTLAVLNVIPVAMGARTLILGMVSRWQYKLPWRHPHHIREDGRTEGS